MNLDIEGIRQRWKDHHKTGGKPFELSRHEAYCVWALFRSRVHMILDRSDENRCPGCAGETYGRPYEKSIGLDFSRRQCNECGTIRDEVEGP